MEFNYTFYRDVFYSYFSVYIFRKYDLPCVRFEKNVVRFQIQNTSIQFVTESCLEFMEFPNFYS